LELQLAQLKQEHERLHLRLVIARCKIQAEQTESIPLRVCTEDVPHRDEENVAFNLKDTIHACHGKIINMEVHPPCIKTLPCIHEVTITYQINQEMNYDTIRELAEQNNIKLPFH
jgi:hypothetical protein